ncbi:LOW QUALITY PROTEIN: tetraspanin-19 [Gossypium raimondii]|uniref:LOW QUALITY PROTEIN: tetraspanin-19 n=1 Tax=Gossypium raimondii TaxID=29730 RepID=UPI00227A59FA|nr:LOW QUALITY PROTEIN: tetraspanin-19 [Gossypium raimondii]
MSAKAHPAGCPFLPIVQKAHLAGLAFLRTVWKACSAGRAFLPTVQKSHSVGFIYTLLGLGVTLCLITYSGHVAGCCLYLYMTLLFLLLMLEAGVTTDVFFNQDWEEDFPVEPTESFNKFEDFVRSNFEFCKWIGLSVVFIQVWGLCVVSAVLLEAVGPYQNYESDDNIDPESMPLLKNDVHPTYVVGRPVSGSKSIA